MGLTKQGDFEIKYHHIDAPTVTDEEYGRLFHKRILTNSCEPETFRDPLIAHLAPLEWIPRRKLDGANVRINWDGEQALWNGKTNNFVAPHQLTDYMNNTFFEEIFEEKFGRDCNVTIFGEYMGPKVQGNELNLYEPEVIIFDVNINGFWQPKDNVIQIANYFNARTCYDFSVECGGPMSLVAIINKVSRGFFPNWEGIVATPAVECRNQRGERIIVKVKARDYYRPQNAIDKINR